MSSKPKKVKECPFEKLGSVTSRLPIMDLLVIDILLHDIKCIYTNRSDFIRHAVRTLICHEISIDLNLKKFFEERMQIDMVKYIQIAEREAQKLKEIK
jgi:hypothetical protein